MQQTSTASTTATTQCPHCGRTLKGREIENPLTHEPMVIGYEPCTCHDAVRERREEDVRRATEDKERRERPARNAGIPARYRSLTARPNKAFIERLQAGRNVLIWGGVGTGKTYFACCIALAMLERGYSVRFTTSTEFLRAVKSAYDRHVSEEAALQAFTGCQVLVLDDLGQEKVTDWALEKLFDLINARYNSMLPTVVTIQSEPSELAAHFEKTGDVRKAEALVSRLQEKALARVMEGGDRRLENNDG